MSRKIKWKGIPLNHTNIDEYMDDLYNDTAGQYITQGVSFNKDDNFQMNLLKNALLSHGSFSGFIKHLLFNYFEENGKLEDSIWIPNATSTEDAVKEVENKTVQEHTKEPENAQNTTDTEVQEQESPAPPTPPSDKKAPKVERKKTHKNVVGSGISKSLLEPLED